MRKWNCMLRFNDNAVGTSELRKRNWLLFGYVSCQQRHEGKKYKYVHGLLSGYPLKFYIIPRKKKPYVTFVIFPYRRIFIPEVRNKRIFRCFCELVLRQGMVQMRRPFLREITKGREPRYVFWSSIKQKYFMKCSLPRGFGWKTAVSCYALCLHEGMYKDPDFLVQKEQMFEDAVLVFDRVLVKKDIEVLWRWLRLRLFPEDIEDALVQKFGGEVLPWIKEIRESDIRNVYKKNIN